VGVQSPRIFFNYHYGLKTIFCDICANNKKQYVFHTQNNIFFWGGGISPPQVMTMTVQWVKVRRPNDITSFITITPLLYLHVEVYDFYFISTAKIESRFFHTCTRYEVNTCNNSQNSYYCFL